MANQYKPAPGPPPEYPQQPPQAHYDAGPYGGDPRAAQGYYGSPPPPMEYGNQVVYNQGPYGPPPQGMYYQQPMYYQQGPPPGAYYDNRGPGAGPGICAGLFGALACCCCLDLLI